MPDDLLKERTEKRPVRQVVQDAASMSRCWINSTERMCKKRTQGVTALAAPSDDQARPGEPRHLQKFAVLWYVSAGAAPGKIWRICLHSGAGPPLAEAVSHPECMLQHLPGNSWPVLSAGMWAS